MASIDAHNTSPIAAGATNTTVVPKTQAPVRVPPLTANRSASPKAQNGANPTKPKSTTAGAPSPKSSIVQPVRPTVITLKQVNALLAHQHQQKQQTTTAVRSKAATMVPTTPERQMMRMGAHGISMTSPMALVAPPVPLSPSFVVTKSPPPAIVVRKAKETA